MPHNLQLWQRVNDPQRGNGTIYRIAYGTASVMFDDGGEDIAYPLATAHKWLGSVTQPIFAEVAV